MNETNWFSTSSIEQISIKELVSAFEDKKLCLPIYQRDFVWSEGRICALWDSLLRGFPLPAFLLANGEVKGQSRKISSSCSRGESIDSNNGDTYNVIDGQQRLMAILAGAGILENIKIWIDIEPPNKPHPLKFKHWLHPCTQIFPYGFYNEASGEHDFRALSDNDLGDICSKKDLTEIYEGDLTKSFPEKATTPVRLDSIFNLIASSTENNSNDDNDIKDRIISLARKHNQKYEPQKKGNENTLNTLAKAIRKIKETKLVLQKIEDDIFGDDEESYTLFERIGRGGVQITSKQLAVSKIIQQLGSDGNTALVKFRNSNYGELLDTEDVVHAITRVALELAKTENNDDTKEDLIELNLANLEKIKLSNGLWEKFFEKIKSFTSSNCDISNTFNKLFQSLRYNSKENEYGFPLVQLALSNQNSKEGISPVTLHPLLLWLEKHNKDIDNKIKEDMLRWILFANGFTAQPQNHSMNRTIFNQVNNDCFDFGKALKEILASDNEQAWNPKTTEEEKEQLRKEAQRARSDLGFILDHPNERDDGTVEYTQQQHRDLLQVNEIRDLTVKRLFLRNNTTSMVGDFVLMWNQREALEEFYGKNERNHIAALFSKGRPFDADHIMARNKLMNHSSFPDKKLLDETAKTFIHEIKTNHLTPDIFRKNVTHMNGNYRYWPKRLNRSDQDKSVNDKMNHYNINKTPPYSIKFENNEQVYNFSAINIKNIEKWQGLPNDRKNWKQKNITDFIEAILNREADLYEKAYQFIKGVDKK